VLIRQKPRHSAARKGQEVIEDGEGGLGVCVPGLGGDEKGEYEYKQAVSSYHCCFFSFISQKKRTKTEASSHLLSMVLCRHLFREKRSLDNELAVPVRGVYYSISCPCNNQHFVRCKFFVDKFFSHPHHPSCGHSSPASFRRP